MKKGYELMQIETYSSSKKKLFEKYLLKNIIYNTIYIELFYSVDNGST